MAICGGVGAVGCTYTAVVGRVDGAPVENSGFGFGFSVVVSTGFADDSSDDTSENLNRNSGSGIDPLIDRLVS